MNIIDVLTDFRVDFREGGTHRHVQPGFIGLDCFTCSPSTQKYKLGVRLSTLWCGCWSCGPFRLDEVLVEVLKIPHPEAGKLAIQLRGGRRDNYTLKRPQEATGTLKIPKGVGPLHKLHKAYLRRRGFDPDNLVKLWGIGGIGFTDKLPWRIFIPVTQNSETVSWTTRAISDEADSPYINAGDEESKYRLKSLLMGEDYVRHSIIVVEGPLDVFAIGPGAVCTFGVQYTQEQVRRISKYPIRVINFDAEPVAQRQAKKLVNELSAWPGETHNVVLTSGKDASRASQDDVKELRRRFLD